MDFDSTEEYFSVNNQRVLIKLSNDTLTWESMKKKHDNTGTINLRDILKICENNKCSRSFDIHWVKGKPKCKYGVTKTVITCQNEEQRRRWTENIREQHQTTCSNRPRRLLVLINPQAGRRKALHNYMKKAAPLFSLAGVNTDVIVTERKFHATEILQSYDLGSIDGVVSVGGDGTFKEMLNGLILRSMKDAGHDPSDKNHALVKPAVKVAAMAGGSGNAIAMILYKTKDMCSAAVNIIKGQNEKKLNIGAVFSGSRLLGYNFLIMTLGFTAEYMYDAEEKRSCQCLGQFRYLYPFAKNMARRRPVDLEIELRAADTPENDNVEGCAGTVQSINGAFIDFLCQPSRMYLTEEKLLELKEGSGSLLTVKPCTVGQHMRFFRNFVRTEDLDFVSFDYVTSTQVHEVDVRIVGGGIPRQNGQYFVNLDGEIVMLEDNPTASIVVHRGVVECFAM